MPLYSSSYLKQLYANRTFTIRDKLLSESEKVHTSFDIFLCHSFLDREEVNGIYIELSNLGYTVYVDWIIDSNLDRNNITKESAEAIRRRLRMSKSLLLAISTNAALSKWIPWELGYVDGHVSKCALFPVSKTVTAQNTFERSEYLLLYPYVKTAKALGVDKTYITESSNNYVPLDDWLRRNQNPSFRFTNIDNL